MDYTHKNVVVRPAIILVRKRPGIKTPKHIRDNFNFAGLIDNITNIADKASTALDKVGTVVNKAGQTITTVKDAAGNIKQIIQPTPNPSGGQYYYPAPAADNNAKALTLTPDVMLMVGGTVLLLIVALFITRK